LTLTPERAIEMLEQLRPYTVIGPWVYEEVGDDETDTVFLRWDRYCFTSKIAAAVITSYGDCWRIEWLFREELLYEDSYPTAELAKAAVDTHLATLPNVLALGVEPKGDQHE